MNPTITAAVIAATIAAITNIIYDAIKHRYFQQQQYVKEQLSEFYDPMLILLSVNSDIFEKIGPLSRKRNESDYVREQNHRVWSELAETVIIPNNTAICDIIRSKMHLISDDDNLASYIKFTTHAFMYREFHKKPFENYEHFQFPTDFSEHVLQQHQKLRKRLKH